MKIKKRLYIFILAMFWVFLGLGQVSFASQGDSKCHIIYDAGSSGTRLYIYQYQDQNWIEHQGPKVSALADPVRGIRGKGEKDISFVISEVVGALDLIKNDGPNKNGKVAWKAFDWQSSCDLISANVYATAGMRIAEQENPTSSVKLWKELKNQLSSKVGQGVKVDTRTITGYEEGLYAWLAIRDIKKSDNFGIVEMGGASSQLTFPCPSCDANNSAMRKVKFDGKLLPMYSYSFLGLGQDEASKSLGFPSSCVYGVGKSDAKWQTNECAKHIIIKNQHGMNDPYNYKGNKKGTYNQIPSQQTTISSWYLTGAFNYMDDCDIKNCCQSKDDCFNPETSCFRAIYLKKYLFEIHVPETSARIDESWTKGAVVCKSQACLSQAKAPVCRWLADGCLQ